MLDMKKFYGEGEEPLDRLVPDGGFTGIFRKIGCIGDSLSSGEFQLKNAEGNNTYHDMYEYSWGQYLARMAGTTALNFSRGGMTAKEYWDTFAGANGYWNAAAGCDAFIIALGVNDINAMLGGKLPFGSLSDIREDPENNEKTFAGYYAAIIQRIQKTNPYAPFFLMTLPRSDREAQDPEERRTLREKHRELLLQMAERFSHCYVLDFRKYAPTYDEDFRRHFYLDGHMNPAGYLFTAKLVASYIDYYVRTRPERFCQVAFAHSTMFHPDYYK